MYLNCMSIALLACGYKTPAGIKYSILMEDEMIIATTDINNIQYALLFMEVNEEEMHGVINSVDLSGYIK